MLMVSFMPLGIVSFLLVDLYLVIICGISTVQSLYIYFYNSLLLLILIVFIFMLSNFTIFTSCSVTLIVFSSALSTG